MVGLGAAGRLVERDLEVVPQVGAALRPAATAASTEEVAEAEDVAEPAEDVLEPDEHVRVEPAGARGRADAGVTEAVVQAPLLRVGEDGVGLGRFLEPLFRFLAALVAVGMVLERQLAVGALDLLVGCAAGEIPSTS
jgi:hypothetical protein